MKPAIATSTATPSASRTMLNKLFSVVEDSKAEQITTLDVHRISDVSDFFIIANGRSDRHVQGIARRILDFAEQCGLTPISVEGFEKGHWILIDLGDIVAHIFYAPLRQEYNLDGLWSEAPRVSVKKRRKAQLQAA